MTTLDTNAIKDLIIPIARKYGIERVFIFGSVARGEANANSDYDFLITKGNLQNLIQYASFISELENTLKCHVDVITDTSSDAELINVAMQEAILLYER